MDERERERREFFFPKQTHTESEKNQSDECSLCTHIYLDVYKAVVLTEKNSIVAQNKRARASIHLHPKILYKTPEKGLNIVASVKGKPCRFSSTLYTNTVIPCNIFI